MKDVKMNQVPEKTPPFKRPSKKHQPRGLTILFEDQDLIVVDKIHGLLTMASEKEREKTAYFLLNDYVKKGNQRSKSRVFIVHRLDRETSGVLVFAKNETAKLALQENWKAFSKTYFAVVSGNLKEKEGLISSYLAENKSFRVYATTDQEKGKLAQTEYKVLKESGKLSLLEINLLTGRKHQIRVHLAEKGHPVIGDKMYGNPDKGARRLMLHAGSLRILHPKTKKEMLFEAPLPTDFRV